MSKEYDIDDFENTEELMDDFKDYYDKEDSENNIADAMEPTEEKKDADKRITDYKMKPADQKELIARMENVLEACQMYRIPCFLSAAVKNENGKTEYKNILYGSKSNNIRLYEDQIESHVLISNGFVAVPKRETLLLDVEDIADFEPLTTDSAEEE